jgi:hypothetical protein
VVAQTPAALANALDRNLARRRKDLSGLVLDWRGLAKDTADEKRYRRLVVVMLYAHWEGFIKDAGIAYLKYVASLGLKSSDLNFSMRAIAARGHIIASGTAKKSSVHAKMLADLAQLESQPFVRFPKSCIDTESNLTSKVFREIVATLGLRFLAAYELLMHRIDANLVHQRNEVAHGQLTDPDFVETNALVDEVWKKLESFKRQVEDAASRQTYLA